MAIGLPRSRRTEGVGAHDLSLPALCIPDRCQKFKHLIVHRHIPGHPRSRFGPSHSIYGDAPQETSLILAVHEFTVSVSHSRYPWTTLHPSGFSTFVVLVPLKAILSSQHHQHQIPSPKKKQ